MYSEGRDYSFLFKRARFEAKQGLKARYLRRMQTVISDPQKKEDIREHQFLPYFPNSVEFGLRHQDLKERSRPGESGPWELEAQYT